MQGAIREIAGEIVCADGRRLPALVNSVLKRDADGEPLLVRTTIFDASDRRRYEHELLAARDRERTRASATERLQRLSRALVAAADMRAVARGGRRSSSRGSPRHGPAWRCATTRRTCYGPCSSHGAATTDPPRGAARRCSRRTRPAPSRGSRSAPSRCPACSGWRSTVHGGSRRTSARCSSPTPARPRSALERSRLYEEQRDVAHVLQQSMLGAAPRRDPRYEVAALYEPSSEHLEVGGDWHDTFALPNGRVAS